MTQSNSISQHKADFFSENQTIALQGCDSLVEIGGQDILQFFISNLSQENVRLRNLAALGLHELADNQALEPLLQAINKPENKNSNGTMAYALETLDCSKNFQEIFDLLFFGDAEVKMVATTILDEQIFFFSTEELLKVQKNWEDIKSSSENYDYYQDYKDIIEILLDRHDTYHQTRKTNC